MGEDKPGQTIRLLTVLRSALALTARADRRGLVIVSACSIFAGLVAGGSLFLLQRALQPLVREAGGAAGERLSAAAPWLLATIGLGLVNQLVGLLQELRQETFTERVSRRAGLELMDAVSQLDLIEFESTALFDKLQRVTTALDYRPMMVVQGLATFGSSLATVVGLLFTLAALSPILIPLLVLAQFPKWLALRFTHRDQEEFIRFATPLERERGYVRSLVTDPDSAAELRSFGTYQYLRGRYESLSERRLRELRVRLRKRTRYTAWAALAGAVTSLVVLAGLVLFARHLGLSLAAAGAAVYGLVQLQHSFLMLEYSGGQLYESALFLTEGEEFLRDGRAALPLRPNGAAPATPGEIRLWGVSFSYPQALRPALSEVDLTVAPGQVVALVGENGSGKTTLAKLLAGLYAPSSGKITWDGVDLAGVDAVQVPERVTVVFQDYLRYMFTAGENIGIGRPELLGEQDRIEQAAREAGAAEVIAGLAAGYDNVLGRLLPGGQDLSVGQWQRIAIARAFFRDTPLVILDEPTAALDPRAEQELFDRTRQLFVDRSVLLISHRFSSVRHADQIHLLAHGRIVESGTHQELMALRGSYHRLFTLQAAGFLAGPDPAAESGEMACVAPESAESAGSGESTELGGDPA